MSSVRRFTFAVVACLLAVSVALLLAEGALRIVYRDGGTRTSGAPGGGPFVYAHNGGGRRAPAPPPEPKRPGIVRVVIQGDSVTWGQGVRNWFDLYPMRLLERLNERGERYEVDVFALPGREITSHVAGLQTYPDTLAPDILIYQWYVNDLEVVKVNRPDPLAAPWRRWSGHYWAWTRSYLYFFLDDRLRLLVPGGERDYAKFMLDEYSPDTRRWALFRGQFNEWVRLAKIRSPRPIVMLYPTLLANGGDPLSRLRQQVADLARSHHLEVLDPTPHLQGFNTHASLFDSHPNEDAHAAMADALYEQIVGGSP